MLAPDARRLRQMKISIAPEAVNDRSRLPGRGRDSQHYGRRLASYGDPIGLRAGVVGTVAAAERMTRPIVELEQYRALEHEHEFLAIGSHEVLARNSRPV